MRTFQTLALIGCILGILVTFGLLTIEGFLMRTGETASTFVVGLALAFLLYIVGIVITFVVKKTKGVGVTLLAIGVIAMIVTNGWGIVAFALLLPAGIVALRE
jgi:hypothetical protein